MELTGEKLTLHFLHLEVLLRELSMIEQEFSELLLGRTSPHQLGLCVMKAPPCKPGE